MVCQSGPIAQKVINEFRQFKGRKVFDFKQIDAGRRKKEDLQRTVALTKELVELHPAHALYAYAQNQAAVLSEQITQLPPMSRFVDLIGKAEDEYLPSGPPISPLTASYFTCWAMFDACIGESRKTIGTCTIRRDRRSHPNPKSFVRLGFRADRAPALSGPCPELSRPLAGTGGNRRPPTA